MWFRLKQLVLHDFWLKAVAVLVAILVRITVSTAIQQEAEISTHGMNIGAGRIFSNVPVLVVSSAADVRKFRVQPETVEVEVRGSTKALAHLRERDIRVTVDLTGLTATNKGWQRVDVSLPAGVMLVRVSPPQVLVINTHSE